MRNWLFLMYLLVIFGVAPAIADKEFTSTIVTAPGSPVLLNKCEAFTRNLNKSSLGMNYAIPEFYFDLGISFQNVSDKTVSDLRVGVKEYDAFNGTIADGTLDTATDVSANNMAVAPGTSFDLLGPRGWQFPNVHANRDHLTCEVIAAKFSDGSIWTAPPASPAPAG